MDFGGDNFDAADMELKKLRPRGGAVASYQSQQHSQIQDDMVYLDRDILPNDTLQSFSILYGCNVNELKRANNLITEQDFFALKRIKIPVKKFGLLTDSEEERKRRIATTNLTGTPAEEERIDSDLSESDALLTPTKSPDDASRFLKTMDKQIRKSAKESSEVLEEVVSSLGSVGYRPLASPGMMRRHQGVVEECNGSDWGCKWWVVLLGSLLFLLFIFLVIFYEYYWHKQMDEIHHKHPLPHNYHRR